MDEEAAAVVRQIFEWKLQEVSVYTIVERLKAGGIESPERHKRRAGARNGDNTQGEGWCPSTIWGILQNRAYIGEMVCGKSETALYKGLKKHVTETDKWIVVPDTHPPIVSASDFEAVERQMQKDSSMEWPADIRAGLIDLFAGKIFCADCGKRMYYKRQRICGCKNVTFRGVYDCSTHVRRGHAKGASQEYPLKGLLKCGNCHRTLSRFHSTAGYCYQCTKSGADENSDCPKGKLFSEKEIEGIIFQAIMQMLAICQEQKKQKSSLMLTRKERIAG